MIFTGDFTESLFVINNDKTRNSEQSKASKQLKLIN